MDKRDVHETVSRAYAEALRRSQGSSTGCCGPQASGCCAPPADVPSSLANVAGYGDETTAYADAAASSFGCGNPLAFSGVQEGQTVLDLGSGAGLELLIAADKVGPSGTVIGVDMTDAMIETARENATKAGHANVEVRKGTIEALPVDSASVDWVISNCVINLSPDKPAVFAEIARVLAPGGQFSISDIVVEELPQWLRDSAAAYAACIAGAIPEQEYLAGLHAAGLADAQVTERAVYDEQQLRGIVGSDLENLGLSRDLLDSGITAAVGKVWSAKFVGTRR